MLGRLGTTVLVGALNVKDFFAFGRGPSLGIPEAAKPGIYAPVRRVVQAENLPAALAGAVVLAVLVNVVELLCTAGLPPGYTRILTPRALPTSSYYAYLFLYAAAYVLDDALVLTVAVVTLGRRKLHERGGRWLKLVSGAVMLALGLMLLASAASLDGAWVRPAASSPDAVTGWPGPTHACVRTHATPSVAPL